MATFPSLMAMSLPIRVGTIVKSPYKWAAALAPDDKLIQYKNAMLWLEGEGFDSQSEFLAKVERIIKYQEEESHRPVASNPAPLQPVEKEEKEETWTTKTPKPRKPKAPIVLWTRQQLAKGIVDQCIREFERVFSYKGPSLRISEIYPHFDPTQFTFYGLIGDVRDEAANLAVPSTKFPVPKSARYSADGGLGKGKNFNFKIQVKDTAKPNGWSAAAQIHVLWE